MQIYLCFPVCCKTVRIRNDHSQKVHSLLLEQAGWVLRDRKVRRQCQPISFFPSISITQKKFFCLTQQFKLLKYVGGGYLYLIMLAEQTITFCFKDILYSNPATAKIPKYWTIFFLLISAHFWSTLQLSLGPWGYLFSEEKLHFRLTKALLEPPPSKAPYSPPPPSKAVMHSSIYN